MLRLALRAATVAAVLSLALVAAAPLPAASQSGRYTVTPLVSDIPGLAPVTDSNVQNAWGLSRSPTSPWWFSDNGTNMASVYTAAGTLIKIGGLTAQGVPGDPSGSVFTGIAGQFQVGTTASPTTLGTSNFVFDAEDGTISAWRGPTAALVTVPAADNAVFKGLALANTSAGWRLYATDFHNGRVDAFNGSWTNVTEPGQFVDPDIPAGYAPFGIQTIGDRVFVTYAVQDSVAHDDVAGQGNGFVDAYDLDGNLLGRVAQHGQLNSPWGLAWAPADFGAFGGDLLVGNFGDGQINAYAELPNGHFEHRGSLQGPDGSKLVVDGLWALEFGNAGSNGSPDQLFFTAGPNGEAEGMFGFIKASS